MCALHALTLVVVVRDSRRSSLRDVEVRARPFHCRCSQCVSTPHEVEHVCKCRVCTCAQTQRGETLCVCVLIVCVWVCVIACVNKCNSANNGKAQTQTELSDPIS